MDDELRVGAAVVLRVLAAPRRMGRIRLRLHDADLEGDELLDEIVFARWGLLFSDGQRHVMLLAKNRLSVHPPIQMVIVCRRRGWPAGDKDPADATGSHRGAFVFC